MTFRSTSEFATEQDLQLEGDAPARLYLLVIGKDFVATYPLPETGEVIIGRSRESGVHLQFQTISRRHAAIRLGPEKMLLRDLDSANGTFVRGRRLDANEEVTIARDEVFELGSAMMIVQRRAVPLRPRRFWNHDYFEARVAEECARAEQAGSRFALVQI